jgi:light-regulated signal transduction histidine kinase (bacteriophytochrome)
VVLDIAVVFPGDDRVRHVELAGRPTVAETSAEPSGESVIDGRHRDAPRVEVSAERQPDCWEFAVADDGIGIDPAKTDRIFEVFKRLHHDDEYSGTGIGLSLCQEIVENHGGDVRVESEPGEGSTFFVTLPRDTAE